MSTSNGKDTAQDATDGLPNAPASEHPTDDNDDGEQKTMSTMKDQVKDRAQNDLDLECCICLENLPKDPANFIRQTCCGQGMHKHCTTDLISMNMNGTCPLCRAKTPSSDEESVKHLRPWVKKKKAWALSMMGQMYKKGEGLKQSYKMAKRLYEQAAQQGDASAMCYIGEMYAHGEGVEQSYEKAIEYYEQAAQLGDAKAQFNLGNMYYKGQGAERNLKKAREWWTKAAAQGKKSAAENLKITQHLYKQLNEKNIITPI
jgi:hypothetical protein